MSVTTTANPLTHQISHVRADYQLTHSHTPNAEMDASLTSHPAPSSQNPSHWPTTHRRVPAFRPVNTQLDQRERRVYQNGGERAFITAMFAGVSLQSTVSKLWRNSLGRVWTVGYKLGGEW